MVTDRYAILFLPAIIRSEHDSSLDALVALDLPRGEAMDLTVAGWGGAPLAILAAVDGGRRATPGWALGRLQHLSR